MTFMAAIITYHMDTIATIGTGPTIIIIRIITDMGTAIHITTIVTITTAMRGIPTTMATTLGHMVMATPDIGDAWGL